MNVLNMDTLHHRSKKRVRDLGEVFTPEKYVEDMLDLLVGGKDKKKFWGNEDNVFFEPCCGHGNFVLAIYRRRLDAIYRKKLSRYSKNACLYAVANSLNTLWAIDIDKENINNCRTRIFSYTLEFLKSKLGYDDELDLMADHEDFFAHILSAIKWHIDENETLSALSSHENAKVNASKTKSGKSWFEKHGHHQVDFELTWARFFEDCELNNSIPIDFEKSYVFVKSLVKGKKKHLNDFSFTGFLFKRRYSPMIERIA